MAKVLMRQRRPQLTSSTIERMLGWGKHLMADPDFNWTADDQRSMGFLADEIRRIAHVTYLIRKGRRAGFTNYNNSKEKRCKKK